MASVKLATLVIRTLAKPISNQLKEQAQQHETFRKLCIGLAQWSYRTETRLRTSLLGESPKAVKPLNDTRAIQNGANTLAEAFLFGVAASIILAETWRSSRSQGRRRDLIDDQIADLTVKITELTKTVESLDEKFAENWEVLQNRNSEISRILSHVVEIGLRDSWSELEGTRVPASYTLPVISESAEDS
ncbi:hypothetical protein BOTBODRAFT_154595 [Botryobasidium botryosum FD-172 SS1]|uniref:OPA3-domain-containing protein n=1 Tax=Botryobasidium botryosum (strain FD-172 SS1) TaxID=930990 RepID=A0A067N4D4_BOTB1|nr:hypothetical protein BOTBODRAFT_154595 [Botryobasidium botryosum FD-172 SS1]